MSALTAQQKAAFARRVKAGLNPVAACGVCGSGEIDAREAVQYCEECFDFEVNGAEVSCRSCRARYRVLRRQGCQKDGEEREAAHRRAAEYRAGRATPGAGHPDEPVEQEAVKEERG